MYRQKFMRILLKVIVSCLIAFPVYWMLVSSINKNIFANPPHLFPLETTWAYIQNNIHNEQIWQWLKNTFLLTAGTVTLNIMFGSMGAYVLGKYRFKGNTLILLLVLSTQMIPTVLIVAPMYLLLSKVGLINTFWALIISDLALTLPLSTWILKSFFEMLPKEIFEAAKIDGCSEFGIFINIAIPLVKPALATIAILTAFNVWNEFLFASTYISDPAKWVVSTGLSSYIGQFLTSWNDIMANTLIFAIIPMVTYFLLHRYIVGGITKGAIKG